jgi:hypothetical protein
LVVRAPLTSEKPSKINNRAATARSLKTLGKLIIFYRVP